MLLGSLTFGCFSTLWTSLSFLLSAAPFHYGNAAIGLFGLAGVAGAGAASLAGRLADRGLLAHTTTAAILISLVSWGILALGKTAVIPLIIGIATLDLGLQGLHISNQHAIYALAPEARSRLTTAYMVSYFLGGAVCSALSSAVYDGDGWDGVCVLGRGDRGDRTRRLGGNRGHPAENSPQPKPGRRVRREPRRRARIRGRGWVARPASSDQAATARCWVVWTGWRSLTSAAWSRWCGKDSGAIAPISGDQPGLIGAGGASTRQSHLTPARPGGEGRSPEMTRRNHPHLRADPG